MMLSLLTLFQGMEYRIICGPRRRSITSVEDDSREIKTGSLFVAIMGYQVDGHSYIPKAVEMQAGAIVVDANRTSFSEEEILQKYGTCNVTFVEVDNTRRALALLCASYYNHPEDRLDLVGITGTKGKTTASYMIHNILKLDDHETGLVGTVCVMIGDKKIITKNTTPGAKEVFNLLEQMAIDQLDSCVMEVSSQALKLDRVYGIRYDVGCFTNLYLDHISENEHSDMDEYLQCKLMLFDQSKIAVVNSDSDVSEKVISYASKRCPVFTYGLTEDSDCYATNIRCDKQNDYVGTSFDLVCPWYEGEVFVSLPGKFNVYNALCAICTAGLLKVDFETVKKGLASTEVPGRVQPIENKLGKNILVDYAHNAASLDSLISAMREYTTGRIITVFGCGGDRSTTRRGEMGLVSGKLADYTIVTSDNPRTEEPSQIIDMIVDGIKKTNGKYEVIVDREKAIRRAVEFAKPGDMVLIAGKGHEDYQIFADRTIHFDDAEVATQIVREIEASEVKK